ncbi:MAG: type IV pilus assembly protein PilM [Patescibacteria group bacterium]|jgi:type IV pilus assembly protein PilM
MSSARALGIDISDRTIEVLELEKSGGIFHYVTSARHELPDHIVEDGVIIDAAQLINALTELKASGKPQPFTSNRVVLSLPESRTMRHIFFFPSHFTRNQVVEALPYEAEKVIPFAIGDSPWSFTIIGQEGKNQIVAYAVAPSKLVSAYQQALSGAGFELEVVELESEALVRALVPQSLQDELHVLIDIGARTSTIAIAHKGYIRFSISLPIAGADFTRTIAERLSISKSAAEEKKIHSGMTQKDIRGALAPTIKQIVVQAKKAIQFIEHKTQLKVSSIILCGGSAQLPGLPEHLASLIEYPVSVGNPFTHVATGKQPAPSIVYATVVGLAMRGTDKDMHQNEINLLTT